MSQKTFSREYSLNARTLKSTAERLDLALVDASREGIKFRGRKLGAEAAINVAVRVFLDLSSAERNAVLARLCPVIEQELEQEHGGADPAGSIGDYGLGEAGDDRSSSLARSKPNRKNKGTDPSKSPGKKR